MSLLLQPTQNCLSSDGTDWPAALLWKEALAACLTVGQLGLSSRIWEAGQVKGLVWGLHETSHDYLSQRAGKDSSSLLPAKRLTCSIVDSFEAAPTEQRGGGRLERGGNRRFFACYGSGACSPLEAAASVSANPRLSRRIYTPLAASSSFELILFPRKKPT